MLLQDFEKALELTNDESARADIRSERGAVLNKQKQYYKASKELKEAVRLNSKDSRIWHLLGVAVMCLGDLEESYRAFSKAIELKPQDADHWHSLAMAKKEVQLRFLPPHKPFENEGPRVSNIDMPTLLVPLHNHAP